MIKLNKGLGLTTLVLSLYSCGSDNPKINDDKNCSDNCTEDNIRDSENNILDAGINENIYSNDACTNNCGYDANTNKDSGIDVGTTQDEDGGDGNNIIDGCFNCEYDSGTDSGTNTTQDANNLPDANNNTDSGINDGGNINHNPEIEFVDNNQNIITNYNTIINRNESFKLKIYDEDLTDNLEAKINCGNGETAEWETLTREELTGYYNKICRFTIPGEYNVIGYAKDDHESVNTTLNVNVEDETPFVEAGPDMTIQLNKTYCFNWECNTEDLNIACGSGTNRKSFAPGHSEIGFPYRIESETTIENWFISKDDNRNPDFGRVKEKACIIETYGSGFENYQSGDEVIKRVEIRLSNNNVLSDTFNITLID